MINANAFIIIDEYITAQMSKNVTYQDLIDKPVAAKTVFEAAQAIPADVVGGTVDDFIGWVNANEGSQFNDVEPGVSESFDFHITHGQIVIG